MESLTILGILHFPPSQFRPILYKISQAISSVRFRSLNQVQFENFRDIHPP